MCACKQSCGFVHGLKADAWICQMQNNIRWKMKIQVLFTLLQSRITTSTHQYIKTNQENARRRALRDEWRCLHQHRGEMHGGQKLPTHDQGEQGKRRLLPSRRKHTLSIPVMTLTDITCSWAPYSEPSQLNAWPQPKPNLWPCFDLFPSNCPVILSHTMQGCKIQEHPRAS